MYYYNILYITFKNCAICAFLVSNSTPLSETYCFKQMTVKSEPFEAGAKFFANFFRLFDSNFCLMASPSYFGIM